MKKNLTNAQTATLLEFVAQTFLFKIMSTEGTKRQKDKKTKRQKNKKTKRQKGKKTKRQKNPYECNASFPYSRAIYLIELEHLVAPQSTQLPFK